MHFRGRASYATKCISGSPGGKLGKPAIFQEQVCVMACDDKVKRLVKREAVKSSKETRYSSVQEVSWHGLEEVLGIAASPPCKTPHS